MPPSQTMRAIKTVSSGPLTIETLPVPTPGPEQVLIKIAAAGVNRPDLIQRSGFYPPPPGAPDTMGLEAAGEIVAVGQGVTGWRTGDKVTALLPGGGYAEYALAHHGSCLPWPDRLDAVQAAALPETVLTVWANVFERAGLQPGEAFLVHGGTSGIGTTAIQMARAHGARVFATAGTEEKCALCLSLGAEIAVNYKQQDFETVLRAAGGVDVILDMVGGPYIQKNLDLLNPDGRLVQIAFLKGPSAELNLMKLMLKRLTLTGSTLRARPDAEKARLARAVQTHVWPWIASGKLTPVIDSVLPLAEAEAAQARMQAGDHAGKIMLTP
jgi:NADPH:quinone reductase